MYVNSIINKFSQSIKILFAVDSPIFLLSPMHGYAQRKINHTDQILSCYSLYSIMVIIEDKVYFYKSFFSIHPFIF